MKPWERLCSSSCGLHCHGDQKGVRRVTQDKQQQMRPLTQHTSSGKDPSPLQSQSCKVADPAELGPTKRQEDSDFDQRFGRYASDYDSQFLPPMPGATITDFPNPKIKNSPSRPGSSSRPSAMSRVGWSSVALPGMRALGNPSSKTGAEALLCHPSPTKQPTNLHPLQPCFQKHQAFHPAWRAAQRISK